MLEQKDAGVPRCSCGGIIKPDVVLYEEPLDNDVMAGAISYIMAADLMIVGGTSLAVYPAAGLLQYYQGKELVLINKTDVLPYFDFDMDKVVEYAHRRNPNLKIFPISAKSGLGVDAWRQWLLEETEAWKKG